MMAGRRRTSARIVGPALGYAADLVFGDPRRWHPVAGFRCAATAVERLLWADSQARGVAHVAVSLGAPVGAGLLARRLTRGS